MFTLAIVILITLSVLTWMWLWDDIKQFPYWWYY
jgi:hypothetical protein